MRSGIILATAFAALSATAARADQWCGYADHKDAVVECGYTTVAGCQDAVGKGGVCFVDPDVARNFTPIKPAPRLKIPAHG